MVNTVTVNLKNSDYIQDTYIDEDNPNTTYYNNGEIHVKLGNSAGSEVHRRRGLIAFKIPKPNLPNPSIKDIKLHLYVSGGGNSGSGGTVDAYVSIRHSKEDGWTVPPAIVETTWNHITQGLEWPSKHGGADTSTDYGLGDGWICEPLLVDTSNPPSEYYTFPLTQFVKNNTVEFDRWYGFVIEIVNMPADGDTIEVIFNSMDNADDATHPYLEIDIEYDDAPKIQNLEITPYENNKKLGVAKWDDLDLKDWGNAVAYMEIYRDDDSTTPITTNKGAQIYDVANDKGDTILLDKGGALPITGVALDFYAKLNMEIDVGEAYYDNSTSPPTVQYAYPTPTQSNKVTLIAPTVDDTDVQENVENGLYCVDVAVVLKGNNLSATTNGDGGRGKFTVDIDWGDGIKSEELEHYQALVDTSSSGTNSLTIKEMDVGYFKKGDRVALVDVSSWSYEYKEIVGIDGNTLTFDSNYSISPDLVITTHRHYYAKQDTYNISIVAYNDLGFASNVTTIAHSLSSSNPPTAVISVSNYEPRDGESVYASLKNSYSNKGGTISTYKFAVYNQTNPIISGTSPIHEYKIKVYPNNTVLPSDDQIKVVGISGNARIIGKDTSANIVVEVVSNDTLTSNTFHEVFAIELDTIPSSDFTLQDSAGNTIYTYNSGYNVHYNDTSSQPSVSIWGIVDDGDVDSTYIIIYPRIEYYIDLMTELKDVIESIKIPHARNYYAKEGVEYNAVRLGGKKIQIFNISGSAYTSNGYTSCTLDKGTVSFSGSGGNTPDDILLLKAIVDDGYHKVKFNVEEEEYYGWLVSLNITREAGNLVWKWDGTVVIIP